MKIKIAFCPVFLVLCVGFVFSGCYSRGIPVEVIDSGAKATIKQYLANTAETGTLGSEMITIEENLERLSSEDPAKGTELKKIFEDLKKATSPAVVKTKAKEIISKL